MDIDGNNFLSFFLLFRIGDTQYYYSDCHTDNKLGTHIIKRIIRGTISISFYLEFYTAIQCFVLLYTDVNNNNNKGSHVVTEYFSYAYNVLF